MLQRSMNERGNAIDRCRRIVAISIAVAAMGAGASSMAQTFPSKPIKLVVPFAAGTGSDLLARQFIPRFSELLGQPVVIDNRAGGGGLVAAEFVAGSPPDGYTLFLGTIAQFVIAPAVHGDKLRFRPDRDFTPVGTLARSPMILVTGTGDKAPRTVTELVQRMKSGPTDFSSTGAGGFGHLVGEMFSHRVGAKSATHIPYKGSAQSLTDVAAGEILFAMDSPAAAIGLIKAGKLRALAVTGTERMASMVGIPTLEESGVKDMDLFAWFGLFAPSGVPADVLQKLRSDLSVTVKDVAFRQRLAILELETFENDAATMESSIKRDIPFWQKFIRDSGTRVNQ